MPWNLESRVAPLLAYRKTIQFRLLFRFIRSPKTPQKLIQPQPLHLFQPGVRLDFWAVFEPLLWNQPLGRYRQSARADSKIPGCSPSVVLYTVGSFVCCFIRDFALFAFSPKFPFLSSLLLLPWILTIEARVWSSLTSHSHHLDLQSSKFKKEKAWGRHGAQLFIEIKGWFEDFWCKGLGDHLHSTSSLQF